MGTMRAIAIIAPTAKNLWGRCTQVAPRGFCYVIFETVKCVFKIRIYHYASDKRYADVSLKMHRKCLAAGQSPGPLGSLQRSPDLAGLKSGGRDKGRRKGETTGGDRQLREGIGMREGAGGEKERKRV